MMFMGKSSKKMGENLGWEKTSVATWQIVKKLVIHADSIRFGFQSPSDFPMGEISRSHENQAFFLPSAVAVKKPS